MCVCPFFAIYNSNLDIQLRRATAYLGELCKYVLVFTHKYHKVVELQFTLNYYCIQRLSFTSTMAPPTSAICGVEWRQRWKVCLRVTTSKKKVPCFGLGVSTCAT